ncbi:hypothetical protein FNO01nite_11510 [Flavobacterium noncentrifugens]|uniref:Por secretion system C-terminal sorting domain-containing protein n=1 Tax=Flavobacterium noncentrifugens TaxID=1128970 RepID=A0A1G8VF58_9FLAO|nr:T9SS type A sorting domain-containing protein [Flavobacterium noncentrifugens]GEP50479.1 hypothetical protein FNO01nite_11510 [Flavobacterium noncentrifugens]SDJ64683.1 Por secretion system C-terminal sorting domain-containing protein [Flavobacterium noncentrifugens]
MKKILLLLLVTMLPMAGHSQYTTPGTGVNWGLNDIIINAPAGILSFSDGIYTLSQNLTIAPGDTFSITENTVLHIDANIQLDVAGTFTADAENILITASNIAAPYDSIRFEENSTGFLRNVTINYGKGIRASTGNFQMYNCSMSYHIAGTTTSAAISFSTGRPIVDGSRFTFNVVPALGSGANQEVAAIITNNYIEGNNTSNTNRPQINMGPSGNDTIRITGNTIKGNRELIMVGGISASSLLGNINKVVIDNNVITDNRYGITVAGASSSGYIRGNSIEDNNTQNAPNLGGSGISLNATGAATMNIIASQNQIRRNLWGITVIGTANINLGSNHETTFNEGGNIFSENANGGQTYALFNNTALPISATNNCWIEGTTPTTETVENVISHQVDNAALGLVTFSPFNNCLLGTNAFKNAKISFYPNPNSGLISIETKETGTAEIYNLSGQMLLKSTLKSGTNDIVLNLPSGIYIMKTTTVSGQFTDKVIRQ